MKYSVLRLLGISAFGGEGVGGCIVELPLEKQKIPAFGDIPYNARYKHSGSSHNLAGAFIQIIKASSQYLKFPI